MQVEWVIFTNASSRTTLYNLIFYDSCSRLTFQRTKTTVDNKRRDEGEKRNERKKSRRWKKKKRKVENGDDATAYSYVCVYRRSVCVCVYLRTRVRVWIGSRVCRALVCGCASERARALFVFSFVVRAKFELVPAVRVCTHDRRFVCERHRVSHFRFSS